ncbi:arf-GAP with Rho-GAP domain, ANK repeat and PH domain-containing protein 3-like isoform X1 [Polyodon spathula]|uniref:arf-GAP with Rho-GAP domain, ANK repeat and PH domain-containing protein 3-like isoform X1 n=1 Tax=Polyodon spathula TaxID=7913 RepID=UPI001B7E2D59|nr:arf-GAP with Rho-GAP domain, ANK repeat and PH domain-containing protein 3-like isoform X1 [Polyodon spathula]
MEMSWDEDSGNADVGELLLSIHLERYQDSFRQHGFHTAKDFIHLDNEILLQMGITATGHRKRILKLAQQAPQGDLPQDIEPFWDGPQPDPARDEAPPEEPASLWDLKQLPNNCLPGIPGATTEPHRDQAEAVEKPIPKPRTIFNKPKTEPPIEPPQKCTSNSVIVLEGFVLGESSTDVEEHGSELGEDRLSNCGSLESLVKEEQSAGILPPVPPRIHMGIPPASFTGHGSPGRGEQDKLSTPPLSSSPGSCFSFREVASSTPPTPPYPEMEMVSNEIYSGLSQSQLGVTASALEMRRNRPVPLPPARLEASSSLEKSSTLKSSAEEPPSVPVPTKRILGDISLREASLFSAVHQEEVISPYCETVFQRDRHNREQKTTRAQTEGTGHCKQDDVGDSGRRALLKEQRISQILLSESEGYSMVGEHHAPSQSFSLPPDMYADEMGDDMTISPYASFTSLPDRAQPIISGWLEKLSPQGNYVFQKRFVKFDGKNLMYFSNDKEVYPKGVIPLAAIQMARAAKDNKFEIVTSQRTFVFRADTEVQRNEWSSTLQNRVKDQLVFSRPRFGPGSHCQKSGYLELKGTKSKVYVAINTDQVWLHKNEQGFKNGIGITLIDVRGSTIRDNKSKSFELISPFKVFSFTAESEREKKEWMEALQESIAETLSDYEVAEKIWSNRSNRTCADCKAYNPDWASINLCVIICKNCAGQHRGLGTTISKVQSLKLDTSVWSNEIVQLFIMLGNEKANAFWAARLPSGDELDSDASPDQRREFIGLKYRDGKYRLPHPHFSTQEELLKALCAATVEQNLLKTVTRIFSEVEAADVTDTNGYDNSRNLYETHLYSTDFSSSDDCGSGSVYDEIMQSVLHSGYLYKSTSTSKGTTTKKPREEFQKQWCSLERSLLFYETDKSTEPSMKIELSDIICLGVTRPASLTSPGPFDRFRYTFELYLSSEKLYQFGVESPEALHSWTSALGKACTPLSCHCLLGREFERVGRLRYKAMLDPEQWKEGYFVLQKSNLFICPGSDGAAEDSINLKRLQELSIASQNENNEKKDILVLVEMGRTLYLQSMARMDFSMWYVDIQTAAGGKGNALRDQQLSRNGIPIIVDSCIAFLTQYGLRHEGIYRKNGAKSRIKLLMEEFRRDARNVKLRMGDNFIEDVTDVLKRFFREIDDPVFMADLHHMWQEAAVISEKLQRLDCYKKLICSLPRVNRTTLAALIGHLYRVQKCADLNQMCTKNLSLLFAPSLFQTDGKGEHEVKIIEDLIDNYLYVFDIDEEQLTQMELEISLITTWKDVQLSQAGDLIIEVYLEKKLPDCCITLKVSPMMCAEELTNQVLYMRNIPAGDKDIWLTFEAIESSELERPLHPKEKVLEQALQWCKLPEPSSAYLVVKKIPNGQAIKIFTGFQSEIVKSGGLKCREEPPRLLQGNKFQERFFQIRDCKLLLLKDKKSNKPEKEWPLKTLKVYLGIRKKLKAPTQWGFTVFMEKQQLYLCCSGESEMWDWMTNILKAQHDDLRPAVLRRHSSDLSKQNFGTMPLVSIRGDESNSTMLSANQTLRKLHARRTLSMFFPMKMQQDSFEEQPSSPEPLYEEVGDFGLQVLKSLQASFLSGPSEVPLSRPASQDHRKTGSLDRMIGPNPVRTLCVEGSQGLSQSASLERLRSPDYMEPLVLEDSCTTDPEGPARPCPRKNALSTPSQDKLLQELANVFMKKGEPGNAASQAGQNIL